jgi:hypothetical protein
MPKVVGSHYYDTNAASNWTRCPDATSDTREDAADGREEVRVRGAKDGVMFRTIAYDQQEALNSCKGNDIPVKDSSEQLAMPAESCLFGCA